MFSGRGGPLAGLRGGGGGRAGGPSNPAVAAARHRGHGRRRAPSAEGTLGPRHAGLAGTPLNLPPTRPRDSTCCGDQQVSL